MAHKYDARRHCIWCQEEEATENLKYTLAPDKQTYVVSGYNGSKKEVVIPCKYNGLPVSGIADKAFERNTKIVTVYIHTAMTVIGKEAFSSCTSLLSVSIPSSIVEIGDGAFRGCEKLVEVINRSSLDIKAGGSDFGGIAEKAVTVHDSEESIVKRTEEGFLYFENDGIYLAGYVGEEKDITLPSSIDNKRYSVYKYGMAYSHVTSVVIPAGIKEIDSYAFTYSTALEKLDILSPNTTFGESVFENCIFLKVIL